MSPDYLEIAHASPAYEAACRLRDEVLRHPIGMTLRPEDVAGEESQFHFVAKGGPNCIATVLFKPITPQRIKLRQMAVAPSAQGRGIGATLVRFAERILAARGYRHVETHARCYAQEFYEKLGYQATGTPFEEVGLQTILMRKDIG